jgi:hypothetical protein
VQSPLSDDYYMELPLIATYRAPVNPQEGILSFIFMAVRMP